MLDPPSSMFYDAFGSDLKEKNGEYYFVGYVSPPIPSEMIGKVTASGSVAWCLCYYTSFHPFNYTPATLDATADGGFVFATLVGTTPGIFAAAFIKTDANGNAGCDGTSYSMPTDTVNMITLSDLVTSACGAQATYVASPVNVPVADSVVCEDIQNGVNVEENDLAEGELNVFPNPSNGIYYLQLADGTHPPSSVDVVDVLGNVVHAAKPAQGNLNTIDLSALPDGVYVVRVLSAETVTAIRLLKTK